MNVPKSCGPFYPSFFKLQKKNSFTANFQARMLWRRVR